MIKHNKILVPTDFSEQSTESLRRAGVLAGKFDAEVHLLHVTDPSMYFETDMISASPPEDLEDDNQNSVLAQLKAQMDKCGIDAVLHLEASVGSHARDICEFAQALPADLIVIGRHGEKNVLKHMLVGATVERVVAHAPCSVLVTMPHDLLEAAKQ